MSDTPLLKEGDDPESGSPEDETTEEDDISFERRLWAEMQIPCESFAMFITILGLMMLIEHVRVYMGWIPPPVKFEYSDLHDLIRTTYDSDSDMAYMKSAFMRGVNRGELQSYGYVCIQPRIFDNRFHVVAVQRFNQILQNTIAFYMSNELSSSSELCYVPYSV